MQHEVGMGRITKKTWTSEQEATLRKLASGGASVFRIAAAVNKTTSGVTSRARILGIKIRTNKEIRLRMRDGEQAQQR